MAMFIVRRLAQTLLTVLFVSVLVFALARLTGDPIPQLVPAEASQADLDYLRNQLGLNKPLVMQYLTFVGHALEGNFGNSFRFRQPALGLVLDRLPATAELAGASMLLAIVLGVPTGVLASVRPGRLSDSVVRWFATVGQATPTFWMGLMLILLFAVRLRWFPAEGIGGWQHLVLPTVTLGWYSTAAIARLVRSSMLETLQQDFVRLERLTGLPEWLVVFEHALKNAFIPVITYLALQFGILLSGAVITETVFAWPGVGQFIVTAILTRDYPIIQAAVLITACIFLALNFTVDLLYSYLDPRIRF